MLNINSKDDRVTVLQSVLHDLNEANNTFGTILGPVYRNSIEFRQLEQIDTEITNLVDRVLKLIDQEKRTVPVTPKE